jgi:hypothetical protein
VELCSLTPHFQGPREWLRSGRAWGGIDILVTIDREARLAGSDFRQLDTVALIMHKPRLEQLLSAMTSRDQSQFRAIEYAGGVYLTAATLDVLLQGNGQPEGNISVVLPD